MAFKQEKRNGPHRKTLSEAVQDRDRVWKLLQDFEERGISCPEQRLREEFEAMKREAAERKTAEREDRKRKAVERKTDIPICLISREKYEAMK